MIGHLKTHAGALMYHCTVCAVYFSTLKLVSSHMKLHMDCLPSDFNDEQTFMYNNAQMFMFRCTTPKAHPQSEPQAATTTTDLTPFLCARALCDVVLRVGGHSFPAHHASSYFRGLFSSGRGAGTFTLDCMAPANFEKVLNFMYTAEVFTDLTNVGVVHELVHTCQATFPNLRGSGSSPGSR
ncbi:hypothetical protein AAFF_G00088060 [Aldrovandia affinis]|uniref:C2H2-type domain-containing protein n=1 Tax=Aldrovandia affinis TaxID=143900 RepID=A0AAD7VXK1_9TELE|nr:hypothetical protein AAFF_G00088060 [Aldrovandia affinis]